eukprot:5845433-Prymnesium_polylepis.1
MESECTAAQCTATRAAAPRRSVPTAHAWNSTASIDDCIDWCSCCQRTFGQPPSCTPPVLPSARSVSQCATPPSTSSDGQPADAFASIASRPPHATTGSASYS